jgi:hypothetical protein
MGKRNELHEQDADEILVTAGPFHFMIQKEKK